MKILVLEAIGLHLGYLGCYGNEWVATPSLDRLAAEGIVFDWHLADQPELFPATPWTERSVGTGFYRPHPPHVGKPSVVRCEALTTYARAVVKAFKAEDRWLWVVGPSLVPPWRLKVDLLDGYFDEVDIEEGLSPWVDPPLDIVQLDDTEILQLQSTYAAVVTLFDAQVGAILDRLGEDTFLCVTARSGLPLGEHGMIGAPRPRLHDELVHIPMLWRLPGVQYAGTRIAALTQPVDLLPTFLESLGEPVPPVQGRSLWPLVRGEVETLRPYSVAALQAGGEASRLLRTPDWALHVTESAPSQLYVKPEDRWEVNDLHQQQGEAVDRMQATLRAFLEAVERPAPLVYPPLSEGSSD